MDFWVEIVTLLISGFNDSEDELRRMTEFLAGVSPAIPWHVTAFHADYKMTHPPDTTAGKYNARPGDWTAAPACSSYMPGICRAKWAELENTYCAGCGALLVERSG